MVHCAAVRREGAVLPEEFRPLSGREPALSVAGCGPIRAERVIRPMMVGAAVRLSSGGQFLA